MSTKKDLRTWSNRKGESYSHEVDPTSEARTGKLRTICGSTIPEVSCKSKSVDTACAACEKIRVLRESGKVPRRVSRKPLKHREGMNFMHDGSMKLVVNRQLAREFPAAFVAEKNMSENTARLSQTEKNWVISVAGKRVAFGPIPEST